MSTTDDDQTMTRREHRQIARNSMDEAWAGRSTDRIVSVLEALTHAVLALSAPDDEETR